MSESQESFWKSAPTNKTPTAFAAHSGPASAASGQSPLGHFSLLIFFIFILRFWNQILTCLSVRFRILATS